MTEDHTMIQVGADPGLASRFTVLYTTPGRPRVKQSIGVTFQTEKAAQRVAKALNSAWNSEGRKVWLLPPESENRD